MKARVVITTNLEELRNAEKLGMVFEPKLEISDFTFRLDCVSYACRTQNNRILMNIHGQSIEVEFNDALWERLNSIMPQ